MKRSRIAEFFVTVAVVCLGACTPSLEAKSAGQIGCTPDEISISNEQSHLGLIQSGDTWVAECQGRTFVCSQLNQSGRDKGLFHELFASEQVSCHEAPNSLEAERKRLTQEAAKQAEAQRPASRAPTGAAGFKFGESRADAAHSCEAAGYEWRDEIDQTDKPGCTGAAESLGIDANVNVEFCDGRACAITVEHVPHDKWSQSSVSLKANLESKYGPAQESSSSVPEECRADAAFTRCLEARRLTLRYTWRWAGGESLEMSVGKPRDNVSAAIRLVYRRPAGTADLSAL